MLSTTQNQKETNIFCSAAHQSRFVAAMQHIGKIYEGKYDPEYAAALYILCADSDTWQQVKRYVSRYGIDFETLLEEADYFSHGYEVLITFACNLFNGNMRLDPLELLHLDSRNFHLALQALYVRRHGLRVDAA